MYTLVHAIAKPIDGHTRWQDVDLAAQTFIEIFRTYSKVYLTLTNPFVEGEVTLDLSDIRDKVGTLEVTLADWLVTNANRTLPTSTTPRVIDPKYVKYADAVHAGYAIQTTHNSYAVDYPLTDAEKPSLLLTKPKVDYALFLKSCLVSVNGFFHLTDGSTAGIMVYDGNRSRQISRQAQCGIHSFREVGELQFIPIKKEMLYHQGESKHFQQTYIDIGVDVGDKTVLLVLGGYLHVMDSTYYRVGATQFCIDFGNYPLLKRIYESEKFIDLSSLKMEDSDRNHQMISIADIQSDELIEAYCTLSQSFFVVVDTNDLYVEKIKAQDTGLPGSYVSHIKPQLPLFGGYGRVAEYWYTWEDTQWAINTQELLTQNYNFQSIDPAKMQNVDDTRESYRPDNISSAFFHRIAKDV